MPSRWAFYATAGFIAHQLPVGITGLVIAAVFAATMSTVDSGIHNMSTAIVTDFYGRLKPQRTDDIHP